MSSFVSPGGVWGCHQNEGSSAAAVKGPGQGWRGQRLLDHFLDHLLPNSSGPEPWIHTQLTRGWL